MSIVVCVGVVLAVGVAVISASNSEDIAKYFTFVTWTRREDVAEDITLTGTQATSLDEDIGIDIELLVS